MLQGDAAVLVQHHAHQVRERAVARRGKGDLLRLGLGLRGQFGKGLPGRAGRHHDGQRRRVDLRDRHEVLDRVEAGRAVQRRVHGHDGHLRGQQGVAIRLGLCHEARADIAAGAATVVGDGGLPQHFAEPRGDDARDGIVAAASGKRRDEAQRLRGKAADRRERLRAGGGAGHGEGDGDDGGEGAGQYLLDA